MATAITNRTLPWSWYSDPAVLDLEHDRVFNRFWQYAGHVADVAEPGSYSATIVGRLPVVVVRDQQAELRAFLNVCRHRGAIVCEGTGRRETIPSGGSWSASACCKDATGRPARIASQLSRKPPSGLVR